jgi:gas vesicle structural protein
MRELSAKEGATAVATQASTSGYLTRPQPSGLAEVVDLILDKGLVIDAYIRVSLVGIEVLTIDARIVVASVDTYLRFAEAVNRLDLAAQSKGLPEVVEDVQESGAPEKVKEAVESGKEKLPDVEEAKEKAEGVREKLGKRVDEVRDKVDEVRDRVG